MPSLPETSYGTARTPSISVIFTTITPTTRFATIHVFLLPACYKCYWKRYRPFTKGKLASSTSIGPSKGFGRQATRSENVATEHCQSADKRQKLSRKSRQFATARNCMQHNQTNIQFQFLLKSDCDIWYDRTSEHSSYKTSDRRHSVPPWRAPSMFTETMEHF